MNRDKNMKIVHLMLSIGIAFMHNLCCMEQKRELVKDLKEKIAVGENELQKKKSNKELMLLLAHQKKLKQYDLEQRFLRLPSYLLLSNSLRENKKQVWAQKKSDKNGVWALDDMRLNNKGGYVLWSGRYGRLKNKENIGSTHLFKIDENRNCVKQGSVSFSSTRCDGVISVFNEKSPTIFGIFSNGVQSDKEYSLARWCKSFCEKDSDKNKRYSILSQYYDLGMQEDVIHAAQFSPQDSLLAFSRGSKLVFHQRSDDYPDLVNNRYSFATDYEKYGAIFDMQFSSDGRRIGLLHEKGNGVSLYKVLSTKMNRLEVEWGELQEFSVSANGKTYVTVSALKEAKSMLIAVYDAQTLKLKATCKVLGELYNDGGHMHKSYFSQDDEWFVIHTVYNGRFATVLIDTSSWKVIDTIIHGRERNKRLFKMAGIYGTFIHNKKKKVFVFDIRNSGKVDEVAVNYVPSFAFISPQGYIVTASTEGEQPNVEVYKYNN